MPSVFKINLLKKPGGALRVRVSSTTVKPNEVKNAFEYAKLFRAMIEPFAPITRIDLLIDCAGGAVESALGLSDALESLDRPVRVLITGQCASAATLVAYNPCTESVHIVPGGSILIHLPQIDRYKKQGGVWSVVSRLGNASTIHFMQATYASKTGQPRKTVRAWMEEGRRFTAQEAVAEHLADGIMQQWEWEEVAK